MDPTHLPTDNLWKFMALAGLACAGFCGWLMWKMFEYARSAEEREDETAARLKAKTISLAARLAQLRIDNDQFTLALSETQNDATNLFYANLLREVRSEIASAAARQEALDEEFSAAQVRLSAVRAHSAFLYKMVRFPAVFMFAGVVLSCLGFERWYGNLQVYTDHQTRADFEDHVAELAAKRTARDRAAAGVCPPR